jgi:hypothetical protein
VYTHWLQTICIDTMSKHLPFLDMCPWPFESMLYRGACRDSPIRQPFHTAPHKDLKTKEERRLAKNEYQRLRFKKVTDHEGVGLYRKKKDTYRASANERRKELRRLETLEQRAERMRRRYKEPNNMSNFSGQRVARATPKCSLCSATDHNVRTCKVENSDLLDRSVRCSNCRASGHNKLSCPNASIHTAPGTADRVNGS